MRVLIVTALIIFFPMTVLAQEYSDQPICRIVVDHVPRDDVTYKPGVDVHGKPVVSADLNSGGGYGFKEKPIRIPIELNLFEEFDLSNLNNAALDFEPDVGFVDVFPDGRVEINGQDVRDQTIEICSSAKSLRPPKRLRSEIVPETNMPYPEDDAKTGGGPGRPVTNTTTSNVPVTEIDEVQTRLPGTPVPLQAEDRQEENDSLDLGEPIDGVYYND